MSRIANESCMERDAATDRPLFRSGDSVTVSCGIADPDFPEMPLDGWTGTVIQVERLTAPTRYLVQRTQSALERAPSDCRDRCESEDLVFDQMWLLEGDLEVAPH